MAKKLILVSCAKKTDKVINPNEKIMDITKGCIEQQSQKVNKSNVLNAEKQTDDDIPVSLDFDDYFDDNAVKAYLTLRFKQLNHIERVRESNLNAKKLQAIYLEYETSGEISIAGLSFMIEMYE